MTVTEASTIVMISLPVSGNLEQPITAPILVEHPSATALACGATADG